MKSDRILKVAVNAPLPRLFDYLPPPAATASPGCRVRVPFGRQRLVGMVIDVADASDLPRQKLRRAHSAIDDRPLLDHDDLWLIRFTSDYYHHPIGEVVAAAVPALLRQGRPLLATRSVLRLTEEGALVDLAALSKRAPRQAEILAHLDGAVSFDALDRTLPGWRRTKAALIDKGWVQIDEIPDDPGGDGGESEAAAGPTLNEDQRQAVDAILAGQGFRTTLLDGVTGSGKTEVYLRVMEETLAAGKQVLILVPEIGLTPQFVERVRRRLGRAPVLFHSSLTDSERLSAWRRARSGDADLVLGTRSAVFVPLEEPGLIVIDEEHDASFKQQEGLRYSARDLAIARGKRLDVPVILGSATPSLDSLSHANRGAYQHLTLESRAGGAMAPLLRLVDLNRHDGEDGLSTPLLTAIDDHVGRGGQVLVFLNRRGFAPTLICSACGHIAECRRCDSRMTVHQAEGSLLCHHCGATRRLDSTCGQCGAACVPLGQGTERVEETLKSRFPQHVITRVDSDSTRLKGTMDRALAMAVSGEARILVGTQMLSKGHHFPRLTLVGVVNADQGLFSTDFRGGERLAQSPIQVAGRAGRERQQGEVIIQTAFVSHPFWHELLAGGYHQVARYTLAERETAGWPPFSRLALIRASAHQRQHTWEFLEAAAEIASAAVAAAAPGGSVRVLGPVSAPMERRAGRYRGQLLLQSRRRQSLHQVLSAIARELEQHACSRRARWSIDVDPIELF